MVLGVAVFVLAIALVSFCKYHRVVLSRRNTHSMTPSAGDNAQEITSGVNNDSIKLNVNQAYGGFQSSTATQHADVQDVEYECVDDVLVGNTSQWWYHFSRVYCTCVDVGDTSSITRNSRSLSDRTLTLSQL